ncbi:MAG: acetyl-CoA carboxylase biotin carboxyl carrier protein subunit [Bacteroidales bacterium]|nr:acetyl-CoA carboxylase biotin carboxyl carrier protein subunit [Bacteroidales bacterium]
MKDKATNGTKKTDKKPVVVTNEFVVEYRKYSTELTTKFMNRKPWSPPDDSKILSFIPGTVSKIYVKEGQRVEEGQELLILEAMKMKNTLYVSLPGTIKKILVSEGVQIPKNMVVIEMDYS